MKNDRRQLKWLLAGAAITPFALAAAIASGGAGHGDYVRTAALPAVTAIVATLVLIAILQRRSLRGTYAVDPPAEPHDRVLLVIAGQVIGNLRRPKD